LRPQVQEVADGWETVA